MATSSDEPNRLSDAPRAGLEARRADQDRTLAAIHVVEAALSRAAYGRVEWWQQEVLAALGALEDVTSDEAKGAARPDSLLSQIAFSQPRLRNRVRAVRSRYAQLQEAVGFARRELEHAMEDETDVADVRQRLTTLLSAFRHQRARESDLIYEAYYDVFRVDLDDL